MNSPYTIRFAVGSAYLFISLFQSLALQSQGIPLYYWKHKHFINFGDYLSLKLVERIVGQRVVEYQKNSMAQEKKLLAIGSIISFAHQNDVIWGSGIKRKNIPRITYTFTKLDVRAVRGPLTRDFLKKHFGIECPAVYGDPALLIPYFFPEFKKKDKPAYDYIIIPHYSEQKLFPKDKYPQAVYPTDPWDTIIEKIVNSKLVIASSLHGIIVAEAFGVPARMLRITNNEPLFKYKDYYLGTNRPNFKVAYSLQEAVRMGGEKPMKCDLKKLYEAFPFEFWPDAQFSMPHF